MGKKTLKQKTDCVKWYALVFAIGYFLIGALLRSDGPKFDPGKAYELIRDSLTLTAYFLAPVAAFVLFSDWRQQHAELAIETDSTHIYKEMNGLINKLYNMHFDIEAEENYTEKVSERLSKIMEEISDELKSLEIINNQVESRGTNGQYFAKCAKELMEEIRCINLELSQLGVYKIKMHNPEKYNDYLNTTSEEYSQHIQKSYEGLNYQITRSYPKLNILKANLKVLADSLKIKEPSV